jgi:hypothetical protein
VDTLDARHTQLANRTSNLHNECGRLAAEETRLRNVLSRIATPLSFFDSYALLARRFGAPLEPGEIEEVDSVTQSVQMVVNSGPASPAAAPPRPGTRMSSAGAAASNLPPAPIFPPYLLAKTPITPESPDFSAALDRIDECVAFLAANGARYRGATAAIARFSGLRLHALSLVSGAVRAAVDAVAAEAERELKTAEMVLKAEMLAAASLPQGSPAATAAAERVSAASASLESVEMFQLQVKFRAELGGIRKLVGLVEKRGAKRAYGDVLRDCYAAYTNRRSSLLTPLLRARVRRLVIDRTKGMISRGAAAAAFSKGNAQPASVANTAAAGVVADPQASETQPLPSPQRGRILDFSGQSVYTTGGGSVAGGSVFGRSSVATLWAEGVSAREYVAIDALRSAAAMVARAVQTEYSLFFSLLVAQSGPVHDALLDTNEAVDDDHAQNNRLGSGASVVSKRTGITATVRTSATAAIGGVATYVRSAAESVLGVYLEDLASVLSDVFRPTLHSISSLDILVDAARVLREEVLSELAAPRGPALAPFARAVAVLLGDVQERLAFRAQSYVVDRFVRPQPSTPAVAIALNCPFSLADGRPATLVTVRITSDNDSPARNVAYWYAVRAAAVGAAAAAAADTLADPEAAPAPPPPSAPSPSDAVFPPLTLVLTFLGRLSRVAERGSFEALAQDAVAAVARSLVSAGEARRRSIVNGAVDAYMAARTTVLVGEGEAAISANDLTRCLHAAAVALVPGNQWPQTEMAALLAAAPAATADVDGLLFTAKNLLVLREQISPYALSLASTTQSLDFSSTAEALRKLVSHAGSILNMTSANPLLAFLQTGMPRVAEARVDVKSSLEDLLRGTCEALIARCSTLLAGKAAGHVPGGLSVAAVVNGTKGDLFALLPPLRRRLGLYLGSAVTASILFAPIRERVVAALNKLRGMAEADGGEAADAIAAAFESCFAALEASDSIITDPSSPGFGYDTAVFEARASAPRAAAALTQSQAEKEALAN